MHHLAVVVGVGDRVERKLVFRVIVLGEIKKDGRRLEDIEVVPRGVHNRWNTAVGVDFYEPFLLIGTFRPMEEIYN